MKKKRLDKGIQARKKPLRVKKEKNIETILRIKAEKDGKEWVVNNNGTVIRNKNKKEALRDFATVSGYSVEFI